MHQQVMFTACPKEKTRDGLVVSVLILPRLDPETDPEVLATFPDFVDWPAQNIRWQVAIGNADPIIASVVSAAPSSDLWTGLFSPTTLVRAQPYPDYTKHLWWSYPVGHIVDFIHNLYQHIATNHPTEHPSVQALDATELHTLSHLHDDGRDKRPELLRLLLGRLREERALPPEPPDPENDFLQLWNFHQPGSLTEAPTPPTFDFHEVVALCGEHFGLLRRLGLAVDLLVPGEFPEGSTTVHILPDWTSALGADSSDVLPITQCTIGPSLFLPRPKDPDEIVNGRLPLDGPRYRIVQVDPDGGALNLMMLARNRVQTSLQPSLDTPAQEPLPALRSGGISVARTGHTTQLVGHVDAGFQLNSDRENGDPLVLYAEDLWYGTRFDVFNATTGRWHSLQRRYGFYDFINVDRVEEIAEEAAVVEVPTSRDDEEADPEADKFLYLQESLMRWDGWSLAAPRPGRTLDEQDQVVEEPETTSEGYPLHMSFRAEPGSLPSLRFGTRYQIRARTVDPAGNSVPFDSDPANAAAVTYLRYEPVPTPFVLLTAPRTEGESDRHPVLRSNYDAAPSPSTVERIIAPPRCAQRTAEQHGMWDQVWGNHASVYAQIVEREDKGFHVAGFGVPDPDNYDQPYFPQKPVPITYLPDPMARGAALHFLPDTGDEVLQSFENGAPWPAGWPEARPVRLILEEGNGPPTVQPVDGEVEIRYKLPKAETAQVRVSSYLAEADLDTNAIWRLMATSGATAAQLAEWRSLATKGRLWMITPYQTLTLVHAVRQPLRPPAFQNGALNLVPRQAGDTFARLGGLIDFSRKSTGRMDLHADWKEPVDLGPGGGVAADPPLVGDSMRAHEEWLELPLEQVTGEGLEDLLPINGRRHEFHDTKRRVITYTAKATSKFAEYFQERETHVQVVPSQAHVIVMAPIVEGSEMVRQSGGGPTFDRGTHYDIDYANGNLTWNSSATEVDIVYLPEPISRMSTEAENEVEQQVVLDIPSTARPLAPKVLYAIPTHRWHPFLLGSTGEGGGLRIYLDRPFFETGVGQLLGVVLDPNHNAPSTTLAPYTTRWGFDPIEGLPAPPTTAPRPEDFPLTAPEGVGLGRVLAENGQQVNVVGHAVGFDEARELWYCDIEVESGDAYRPFIRLALASYQPNSVANLHLSPIVLADIVQLTPDRTATVQFKDVVGDHPGIVEVRVIGAGPVPGTPPSMPTEITAHLERKREDVFDDVLGWESIPGEQNQIVLQAERDPSGMTIWTGELNLPAVRLSSHEQFRAVIEEWQIVPVSGDSPDSFETYLPYVETPGSSPSSDSATYLPYVETSGSSASSASTEPNMETPDSSTSSASDESTRRQEQQLSRRLLYRDFIPLGPVGGEGSPPD